jgi:formylmethanofuran dehydrogenase subunit E
MRDYTAEELENMSVEELEELMAEIEEEEEAQKPKPKRKARKQAAPKIESGTKARTERIATGPRPNAFLKSDIAQSHKKDSEIDAKLWQGRQPTPRGDRVSDTIEVECYVCGEPVIISSSVSVPEGRVKCNDCTRQ